MERNDCKISVVFNTYNAAAELPRALSSVAEFDEVVVCDMESSDDTVAIARAHGARVVTYPRGEHRICEPARDTAIHAATHDWVLVVDADEVVTPALRRYLYSYVASAPGDAGLSIGFRPVFMGAVSRGRVERHVRFMRQSLATWPPHIHSRVELRGTVGRVPSSGGRVIEHYNDSGMEARIAKLNRYSSGEVGKRRGRRVGVTALLLRPIWFMLKSLVLAGGWRDGRRGVARAWCEGMYQVMLTTKCLEDRLK